MKKSRFSILGRIILWVEIVVILVALLFIVTCPDEDDYAEWLAEKHDINCVWDGAINTCYKSGVEITKKSTHVKSAGVYMQVGEIYTYMNQKYEIKAVGIFNKIYDYSTYTIYD